MNQMQSRTHMTRHLAPRHRPVRDALTAHLQHRLGAWPPRAGNEVSVTPARDRPGWDGRVRPIQAVLSPEGNVLAVSPRHAALFEGIDPEEALAGLGSTNPSRRVSDLLGVNVSAGITTLRWSEQPADLPETGSWVPADDSRLPEWLHSFPGQVLAAYTPGGEFAAGLGLQVHDAWGVELAVGTDTRHHGQGHARRLVAQAAREIIARGGVPLYRHEAGNAASARVADLAGFPDRGWQLVNLDVEGDRS